MYDLLKVKNSRSSRLDNLTMIPWENFMNSINKNTIHCTYSVAVLFAIIALQQQKATAATLSNGWNYAIDSFSDGVTGDQIGGGAFEFYGIAIKETSDTAFIAINSN